MPRYLVEALAKVRPYGENAIDPMRGVYFSKRQLEDLAHEYVNDRQYEVLNHILEENKMSDRNFKEILKLLDIENETTMIPSEYNFFNSNILTFFRIIEDNRDLLGEEGAIELAKQEFNRLYEHYRDQRNRMFEAVEEVKTAEEKKKELQKRLESKRATISLIEEPQQPLAEVVDQLDQFLLSERVTISEAKKLASQHIEQLENEGKTEVNKENLKGVNEILKWIGFDLEKRKEAEKRAKRKEQKAVKKKIAKSLTDEEFIKLARQFEDVLGESKEPLEPISEEEMRKLLKEADIPYEAEENPVIPIGEGFRRRRRTYLSKYRRGAGIGDFFSEAFSRVKGFIEGPRENAPPIVRNFLSSYGNLEILSMVVCRVPIASGIKFALDVTSLGDFSKKAKEEGYDNMFHLYLYAYVQFNDGTIKTVVMEKNQVARVEFVKNLHKGECMAVPLHGKVTIQQFLERGEKYQGKGFWLYNPSNNNCQVFVISCLRGNQASSPALEKFVVQNAENILTGFAKKIGVAVTDLAGRIDILLHGRAFNIQPSPLKRILPRIRY